MRFPLPNGPRSRITAVFAHPDDEAFFAGATLAGYAAAGCDLHLATLTGGEAIGPAQLRNYAQAARLLGAAEARQLRPGRWQDLGRAGAPRSPAAAPLTDIVTAIEEFLREVRPDVLITTDGDGVTGHPDHRRAQEAVLAARGPVPVVLASCVRGADVRAATSRLSALAPNATIGSGGIRGVEFDPLEIEPTATAIQSRAAALDTYYPGLGSRPLSELVDLAGPVGDGLVLRAVAEAAQHREYFREV